MRVCLAFPPSRIAILKNGVLQASGSSAFLKKRFGLGYNLTLEISADHRGRSSTKDHGVIDAAEFDAKKSRVQQLLETAIPDIELARTLGSQVVFRVPNGSEGRLPFALSTLEMSSRSLSVGAFGIEKSPLEEVVLLLSEDPDMLDTIPHDITASTSEGGSCSTITGGASSAVIEPAPSSFLPAKESQIPLEPLSWVDQVTLLYWKRFAIQRRDLKGLFFTVIAPTLVVALVLLILTLDLSISGPAIEMSPSTLGNENIDVLVGGGAALRNRLTRKRDIAKQVDEMQSTLRPLYKNTQLHYLSNITTSREMSDYLLQSYDDYDGNERYGSYVLHDIIDMFVTVDWPYYESDIRELLNTTLNVITDADADLSDERLRHFIYNLTGVTVGFFDNAVRCPIVLEWL